MQSTKAISVLKWVMMMSRLVGECWYICHCFAQNESMDIVCP